VLTIYPAVCPLDPEALRRALEAENIEARPVWKPMHRQPVFEHCETIGGEVADDLFTRGLCLPSGSRMSTDDLERVVDVLRAAVIGGAKRAAAVQMERVAT